MRNFDGWLGTFRDSISDYKYYISFENVYKNTREFRNELNLLNGLVGSQEIEKDFYDLVRKYPECLKAIPILIAKRESEIFCMDGNGSFLYNFDKPNLSIEQYAYFMNETGLFDLMQIHIISNVYDYVLGVNCGLDSNGRKNRGGHLMEDLCEKYIKDLGLQYGKEIYIDEIERKTGLDLSPISNDGGVTKRFDYVVYGKESTYVFECNFYASGGSKLNETARSYKTLALEARDIKGLTFIWLTDGTGWVSARHNLKETFDILPTIYNIADLENGILKTLK